MTGPRGVFFEEAHARTVVVRLRGAGYDAAVSRDRFAGEDDDEDHPWVVASGAPEWVLDLLVEEYDGWLDLPDPEPGAHPPLELPTAPKRVRRGD